MTYPPPPFDSKKVNHEIFLGLNNFAPSPFKIVQSAFVGLVVRKGIERKGIVNETIAGGMIGRKGEG